jgi:SAM-dependent methyltransferase
MTDWFADEEFWQDTYEVMFPPGRFEKTPGEIDRLLELVDMEPGRALDLCCGPGRHSCELAARGWQVTSVDRSPFLLGQARHHAEEREVDLELVECDMREFRRAGAFDLALSLFTSFGYFDDDEDNQLVLGNLAESLAPGGALVMDMVGKEVLARVYRDAQVAEAHDESTLLIERPRVLPGWQRVENEWIVLQNGQARSYRFRHWLYSGRELSQMLKRAGFERCDLYGGLDGSPYDTTAGRLVAVAWKAGGRHG